MELTKIPYSEHTLTRLTTLFSAMADTSRAQILLTLLHGEKSSGDLAAIFENITHSAVSHQLRWLKDNDVVSARREGRFIYYNLADECIRDIIQVALTHIEEKHQNDRD